VRKVSRVLCLSASILSLALGVSVLFGAVQFYRALNSPQTASVLLGMAIAAVLAAALGAVCLTALKSRQGLSAAMMFAAALLTLPVVLPFLLLVPAGILALVREKPPGSKNPAPVPQPPQPAYSAYPPPTYPGYPPDDAATEYPPSEYPPPGWPQGYPPYDWPYPTGQNDAHSNTHKEAP
jgi:hypothetical protein